MGKFLKKIIAFLKGNKKVQEVVTEVVTDILTNEDHVVENVVKYLSKELQEELLELVEAETQKIIIALTTGKTYDLVLGGIKIIKITNNLQLIRFTNLLKSLIAKTKS